jgi:hypothetical protein
MLAKEALEMSGYEVVEFTVPDATESVAIFMGLMTSVGYQEFEEAVEGEPLLQQYVLPIRLRCAVAVRCL